MRAVLSAARHWRYARLLLICSGLLCYTQSQPVLKHQPVLTSAWSAGTNTIVRSEMLHGLTRHEHFFSPALRRSMDYWVYLPPGYPTSTRHYPVLYMLHGHDANSSQWRQLGLFAQADQLIWQQQIAPVIIVTPQGDNGYWMNHANGGPRWGDYITTDLITYVDGAYRTLPDGLHRAIGGISMGGHGAILLALTHPGLFSVVGGHSPVFRRQKEAFPFFGTGAVYQHHDPLALVRNLKVAVPFQLWLDMGTEDIWLRSTLDFEHALTQRGIAHTWHLLPGGHNAAYWQPHVTEYLCWYDAALGGRPNGQCHAPVPPDSPSPSAKSAIGT